MYRFNEQTTALVDLVRRLVKDFQMPLETRKLRGEKLTRADYLPGREAAREAGLWGLGCPAELGGVEISTVDTLAIAEENFKCLTPLSFGGRTLANLYTLKGEQKALYLDPFIQGRKFLAFAQTEPGGGADPASAVSTSAKHDGKGWVINGSKIWISTFDEADIVFVVARTDRHKGASGISILAVDKGTPGMIAREVPMLGGFTTHQLTFEDCRVDDIALLGGEGTGFKSAQTALVAARFDVAAHCTGIALRCYDMMVDYAKQRQAFGGPLSEKQAIQSMIVDSWIEIQQTRLMLFTCAERTDRGEDMRVEAGMMKMLATEMVDRVIDRAIQIHGAAGCTYESPLAHWYDHQRMARIYEGPNEVHKYRVMARALLA